MNEYHRRREHAQSMLFQSSPTKAALNLKEARKQHRSRVKSIENIQFERVNKQRIFQDLLQLESNWNELQYHKQKDALITSNIHQRSLSKLIKAIDRQPNPEPIARSLYPSKHSISVTNQLTIKSLHRTQIFLMSNSKHYIKDQSSSKHKSSSKKFLNVSVIDHKKSSQYVQKVFNTCVANKQQDSTPKRTRKPQPQQTADTVKRVKPAVKTVSPSPVTNKKYEQSNKQQKRQCNQKKINKSQTQQDFFVTKPAIIKIIR